MEQEIVRGSEYEECEGEESLNPGLSVFINAKHQLKVMEATARNRWRSRGYSDIRQGAAAPEVGPLGPFFGWLLPTAILSS